MKKKLIFVIQILIATVGLFAKQPTLDEAISEVSEDIKNECTKETVLAIYDFELPKDAKNEEMNDYIRGRLTSKLIGQNFDLVTRDTNDFNKREQEIKIQQEYGEFTEETMISIANLWGANRIVYGFVRKISSGYELEVRILSLINLKNPIYRFYEFSDSSKILQLLGNEFVDKKVAQGFGAEINKNSLAFVAPAASVSFDYNILKKVSLGFKIFASWDMYEKNNNFITLEPLASLRFYLVSHGGKPGTGVFLEILGGVSILSINSDIQFGANAGAGYGYRFAFGNFYIEPEIRVGYPYIVGAGISTGFRF